MNLHYSTFLELQSYIDLHRIAKLEKRYERLGKIQALFPIELGPENTLAPMALAAKLGGLFVVDGDGARRAVPTLDLCTFSTVPEREEGLLAAIANGQADTMVIKSNKVPKFDKFLRSIAGAEEFMDSASLAIWPDDIASLADRCIPGTVSLAMYCGQLFEGVRTRNRNLIEEALPFVNTLQSFLIGGGKIVAIDLQISQGFDWKTVIIEDQILGGHTSLLVQNENLIAYNDKTAAPVALAPASICYLGLGPRPLTNGEVEVGMFTYVIGLPAAPQILQNAEIMQNFKSILKELGYAGALEPPQLELRRLGELILDLPRAFPFK